jgi:hypothetical protein
MNEINKDRRPVSVYQQLSGILNAIKSEEITINDAMNKIQLKESQPTRPYCKVTSGGSLALYGISKQPIVLYADQWNKLLKVTKSNYIDNYIKYNETRLKFKPKRILKNYGNKNNNNNSNEEFEDLDDNVIPEGSFDNV